MSGCAGRSSTELVSTCAHAWEPGTSPTPWSSGEFLQSANRSVLRYGQNECDNRVRLGTFYGDSGLVEVSCGDDTYLVNQDTLSCSETNMSIPHQPLMQSNPLDCATCRIIDGMRNITQNTADPMIQDARFSSLAAYERVMRERLVNPAKRRAGQIQRQLNSDFHTIAEVNPPPESGDDSAEAEAKAIEYLSTFVRGQVRLEDQWERISARFGEDCSGSPRGVPGMDVVQGRRTCELVKRSLSLGRHIVARIEHLENRETNSDGGAYRRLANEIYEATAGNYESGYSDVKEPYDPSNPLENNRLSFRMLIFQGLSDARRSSLACGGRVHLIREVPSWISGGEPFFELHDGYVYGGRRRDNFRPRSTLCPRAERNVQARLAGSGGGNDCSDFAAGALDPSGESGIGMPATSHWLRIAQHLEDGRSLSGLPARWRPLASCFVPVNVRRGERLLAGDFVFENGGAAGGPAHIVMVDHFDPQSGVIHTVEASGTVSSQQRDLYEPSCLYPAELRPHWQVRPVRPNLHALRLRPDIGVGGTPGENCPLRLDEE